MQTVDYDVDRPIITWHKRKDSDDSIQFKYNNKKGKLDVHNSSTQKIDDIISSSKPIFT